MIVNELADVMLTDRKLGIPISVPGAAILETFGFHQENYWYDAAALLWMFLVLVTCAYVILQVWVRERR